MASDALLHAAALVRRFEGLYLSPYLCPAAIPTIGYGTTHYPDGVRVTLADPPITKEQAEAYLQHELWKCLNAGLLMCAQLGLWGDKAQAAIGDFIYNLGVTRFQGSTLRRKIMADDMDGACAELAKWVYGGGRRLKGLELRRAAEIALIR